MGVAVGDYDNDGRVDFHNTNFSDDSNTLYRNDGEATFTDVTYQNGLGDSSKIDALEVIWANGQTEKFSIDKINTQITIKQSSGSLK